MGFTVWGLGRFGVWGLRFRVFGFKGSGSTAPLELASVRESKLKKPVAKRKEAGPGAISFCMYTCSGKY